MTRLFKVLQQRLTCIYLSNIFKCYISNYFYKLGSFSSASQAALLNLHVNKQFSDLSALKFKTQRLSWPHMALYNQTLQ